MTKCTLDDVSQTLRAPYWVRRDSDGIISIGRPYGQFIHANIIGGDIAGAKARLDEHYARLGAHVNEQKVPGQKL